MVEPGGSIFHEAVRGYVPGPGFLSLPGIERIRLFDGKTVHSPVEHLTGARMIQALRSGILILIVPPTLVSLGVIFLLYRRRNRFRSASVTPESELEW